MFTALSASDDLALRGDKISLNAHVAKRLEVNKILTVELPRLAQMLRTSGLDAHWAKQPSLIPNRINIEHWLSYYTHPTAEAIALLHEMAVPLFRDLYWEESSGVVSIDNRKFWRIVRTNF